MLIAWMVLMPSSEKSFAASSLVCLSMRTVTLTVSMRTPPASRAHDTAIVRAAIRHGATDIRRVAIEIRRDPLPCAKMVPMMQCAMGAI